MDNASLQPLRFFVYVVESPSAPDIYHQRSESDMLRQAVGLNGVPCVARCAISRIAFRAALQVGIKEEMEKLSGRLPIIHISAHGDVDGLQLSNGETIPWDELGELLAPINKALKNSLVVAMSCCHGYSGTRMAMRNDDSDLPYFTLVGSGDKPTWAETAIAFATFYHHLRRGAHVSDAVAAMRTASGHEAFFLEWGANSRQFYLDYLKRETREEAKREIEQAVEARPADELAKMKSLEHG